MNELLGESKRARLGAFVLFVALLNGVGFGMCRWMESVRPFLTHVTIGLALLGILLWLVRLLQHLKDNTEDAVLHFYANPAFWGTCLLSAATLTFVSVRLTDPRPDVVNARTVEQPIQPAIEFPSLNITGVTLSGARSTAVIGNQIVSVGDSLDGLEVVKIFEDGVVMEKQGERRIYYLNTTHPVLATDGDVVCHHQDCPGNHGSP